MSSRDGSTMMEFEGAMGAQSRRGFAPVIGLSVAAASSLVLWAIVAVLLRWLAHAFL